MQPEGSPSRIPTRIKVEDGVPLAASLEIPRRRTSHAGLSSRAPIKVEVEDVEDEVPSIASPETPRRYPSFSAFQEKWSRSPLRVPTPLAEEFYRSTIVKREGGGAVVSGEELEILCDDCERSAGLPAGFTDRKEPSAEAPRDLRSSQRILDIKTEAEPSPKYYIPTGTYKAETTVPSASTRIQHQIPSTTTQSRLYHEARIVGRDTVTSPPTHRPGTELSYLLPVTPTPFSTPNAPVNPYNRPAHLHCIPGSLLEGMQRRTRWGNRHIRDSHDDKARRARQAKQDKQTARVPVSVPHSQRAPLAENVAEAQQEISNEEADYAHGKTCAWYKVPFCRCCACITVGGTKLLRNMFIPSPVTVPRPHRTTSPIPTPKEWTRKKKWWHLQKCKQRDVDRMMDDESLASRRSAFYNPDRVARG